MPLAQGDEKRRNTSGDPEEFRLPLGEHLEELRQRLIRIVIFLLAGSVIGWFLQPMVYGHLSDLARELMPANVPYREAFRNVTEPFMLKLKLSVYIGLVLFFPFCVLQLWGFVAPGLTPAERKPFRIVAPLSVLFFALGAYFCYMILPSAFGWFVSYLSEFPEVEIIQEPGTLAFFIMKMGLAFGVAFQLPLVVFFLAKVGVLAPSTISSYWRQATVVIFLGSAFLTPSADIFSMLMMAVPMTVLFFGSILAVKLTNRKRPAELDELD
jgi:sec-independent protein translocase protein TatC